MRKEGVEWRDGVRHKYITWLHMSSLKKVPSEAYDMVYRTRSEG